MEEELRRERAELLAEYEDWVEIPALLLGLAWLVLLVIDLTGRLTPLLSRLFDGIWVLFLIDFVLRFALAPAKRAYLRANWITALSLALPALRIFRVFRFVRVLRAARAVRGMNLFRLVSSLNRGMRALRRSFGRRRLGYLLALTVIVTLAGAGGMYAFENPAALADSGVQAVGLATYGEALWWTAMIMTTLGSEYWPRTAEGRLLTFLLSLYALGVFGYLTASLASYFLGQDAARTNESPPVS